LPRCGLLVVAGQLALGLTGSSLRQDAMIVSPQGRRLVN